LVLNNKCPSLMALAFRIGNKKVNFSAFIMPTRCCSIFLSLFFVLVTV